MLVYAMEYLKIGLITKPHGVKGEIKVVPLTDNPERFKSLTKVYIFNNDSYQLEIINSFKNANNIVILKFENYNSRDDVEKLRNNYIYIDKKLGVPLEDNEYYTQDLVDCEFFYKDKSFGNVINVINQGTCDIFIIKYNDKDIFYPFITDYIDNIDIKNKKININYIEGYFD